MAYIVRGHIAYSESPCVHVIADTPDSLRNLFIYYVGHGYFAGSGREYYLALASTNREVPDSTGMRLGSLGDVLKSRARFFRTFYLLDCCFAGEALRALQGGGIDAVAELARGALRVDGLPVWVEVPRRGSSVLCAAGHDDVAMAPEGLRRTVFTDALLDVLQHGDATRGPAFTFSEVSELAWEQIKRKHIDNPEYQVRPVVHAPDQCEGNISTRVPVFPNVVYGVDTAENERIQPRSVEQKHRASEAGIVSMQAGGAAGSAFWLKMTLCLAAALMVVVLPGHLAREAARRSPVAQAGRVSGRTKADFEASPVTLSQGKVDDILEKARMAMRERHYTEPSGDNALFHYRSAVTVAPSSAEAADGLRRVAEVLASRFSESTNRGRFDESGMALANFEIAAPDDGRIPTFEARLITAQIAKALSDGDVDRSTTLIDQARGFSAVSADQINKWKAEANQRREDAKIQRLASLVSDRIREGSLVDPPDDSAKTFLQQLRDLAPTNSGTLRLIHQLNAAFMRKAREATVADHAGEADRWLTEAESVGVSPSEIDSLKKELSNARQEATSAEADRLASLARERIREGHLTDPAQDNAAYYITQVQAVDAKNAAIEPLSRDLAFKLVERARSSAQSGEGDDVVDGDLAQAKRWGADPEDVFAVERIQKSPQVLVSAPADVAGLNLAALTANLKRKKYVPPVFPSMALLERLEGSITLEYTVDKKGDTRDIHVVNATMPGVFDNAALTAVTKWRYEPVAANGVRVEVPARTTIRFQLPWSVTAPVPAPAL